MPVTEWPRPAALDAGLCGRSPVGTASKLGMLRFAPTDSHVVARPFRLAVTLVVNNVRSIFKVVAVEAPGFGDRRKAMLQDPAIVAGGKAISDEVGPTLKKATL